jgi:hypothetical protein
MALLPDDNARKTVVASVMDEKNYMRFHQNLLLYALQAIGYPPEEPREVWWARHKNLFAVEHDAVRAAERVWGWGPDLESCVSGTGNYEMRFRRRYYAARAKEQKYSGNPKFVDAYYELSRSVARSPSLNAELTERNQRLFAW